MKSKASVIRDVIRNDLENFGLATTLYHAAFRAINYLTYFTVLKCMTVTAVDSHYLKSNNRYSYMFLTPDMLFKFAKNQDYDLPEEFLQQALKKGDECYAILDGDTLASYGWYSDKPTNISDALRFHFSNAYIYMYKGYTHNNYRGQRLHAIGMTLALKEYLSRGLKGIVSYVESTNFSSLKSVYRMGYQDVGKIYILKIFGKYLVLRTKGCREYGVWLERL
jgi:hypothetical protein